MIGDDDDMINTLFDIDAEELNHIGDELNEEFLLIFGTTEPAADEFKPSIPLFSIPPDIDDEVQYTNIMKYIFVNTTPEVCIRAILASYNNEPIDPDSTYGMMAYAVDNTFNTMVDVVDMLCTDEIEADGCWYWADDDGVDRYCDYGEEVPSPYQDEAVLIETYCVGDDVYEIDDTHLARPIDYLSFYLEGQYNG